MSINTVYPGKARQVTRHYLHVDSRNRVPGGTISDYQIRLLEPYWNVRNVSLVGLEIANSVYALQRPARFEVELTTAGGTPWTVVGEVPSGNYTPASLKAQLEAIIRQAPVGTEVSVIVDERTLKLSFYSASSDPVKASTIRVVAAPEEFGITVLGHVGLGAPPAAWGANRPVQFYSPNVIFLKITELHDTGRTLMSSAPTYTGGYFARIALSGEPFEFTFLTPADLSQNCSRVIPDTCLLHLSGALSFQWMDRRGEPVEFNGVDHTLLLAIDTDNENYRV